MRCAWRFTSACVWASMSACTPACTTACGRRRTLAGLLVHAAAALLALLAPAARADCFDEAAAYQHVNPAVLRAIAWQESRGRAQAVHHNANGSVDYGLMQINSVHQAELQPFGIAPEELMRPCVGVYVAAWHLRKMMLKYGNTWDAVGAYHSETPALRDRYKEAIQRIVAAHGG